MSSASTPENEQGFRAGARGSVEPYVNNPDSHASRLWRPNYCEE